MDHESLGSCVKFWLCLKNTRKIYKWFELGNGTNWGIGIYTRLQGLRGFPRGLAIKSCVSMLVTQSCPTLCDPMDCSPPGSSVGLAFSSPSALPYPRIKPGSHAMQAASLPSKPPGSPPVVKNAPVMQETWVWSLSQEYPLEEGMATHSSILAWRIPGTKEPGGLQSMGSQRVGHNWSNWGHTHSSGD